MERTVKCEKSGNEYQIVSAPYRHVLDYLRWAGVKHHPATSETLFATAMDKMAAAEDAILQACLSDADLARLNDTLTDAGDLLNILILPGIDKKKVKP